MELNFGSPVKKETKKTTAVSTAEVKDVTIKQQPSVNFSGLSFGSPVKAKPITSKETTITPKPINTPLKQTTTAPQTDAVAPVPVQETPTPVGPQSQTTEEFVATEYPQALTFEELYKKQSEREELDLENPRPVLVTGLSKDHTEYSKILKEKVVGEFATLKGRVDERFDACLLYTSPSPRD